MQNYSTRVFVDPIGRADGSPPSRIPPHSDTTACPAITSNRAMPDPAESVKAEVPTTSSIPLPLPKDQEALFREVLQTLEAAQVPYAVSGAFALREHTGICRYTKDLDVFLTAPDAAVALLHLQQKGFHCDIPDPVWLAKAHRDGFFVDLITGMSNGVIRVEPDWIGRASPANIFGVETRVLAAEELIASKLFVVRRERFDGADIAHIIYGAHHKLQWDRILELAGEHWEILLWDLMLFRYVYPAQTNYVPKPVWQKLLRRLAEEISSPNPQARFRGSLVDDKMFAIDVNEWGLDDLYSESQAQVTKIELAPDKRCS